MGVRVKNKPGKMRGLWGKTVWVNQPWAGRLFFVDDERHNDKVFGGICAVADAVAFALGAKSNVACFKGAGGAVVVIFGGAA